MASTARPAMPQRTVTPLFSQHALSRVDARCLVPAVEATLAFGRVVRTRGAEIYVIGRKEVRRHRRDGIDLARTFEGLGWREHIGGRPLPWEPRALDPDDEAAVQTFMARCGLAFGRLDFLLVDHRLVFLEVNPNGQWAWLHLAGRHGLLDHVVQCLARARGPA